VSARNAAFSTGRERKVNEDRPGYTLIDVTEEGIEATRVHMWPPNHAVLTEVEFAYVFAIGNPMRAVPCIVCGEPVGGGPVMVVIVVCDGVCPSGYAHLPAFSAMRHKACSIDGRQEMIQAILDNVNRCTE
jgi:hypothetical protein